MGITTLATNCACCFELTRYPTISFSLWVVNLIRRIRMQFESKFKRQYCLLSTFSYQNLFSVWTTPQSARYLHFSSSGLQFGKAHKGIWYCFQLPFRVTVSAPFHEAFEEWENPWLESKVLVMFYKTGPQAWAVCFTFSLRTVFRLWGELHFANVSTYTEHV